MNTILNQIKSVVSSVVVLDSNDNLLECLIDHEKGSFYLCSEIDQESISITIDVDVDDDIYQVYYKSYSSSEGIEKDLQDFFANLQ
jgi:hypothetical protein